MFNPFTDLADDSGYPLKRSLLTPIPNPQSTEERTYNLRHNQARTFVECTIGLLKGRWNTIAMSVYAVLHNVAQLKDVALPPDADRLGPDPDPYPQAFKPNAAAVRQRLDVMLHA